MKLIGFQIKNVKSIIDTGYHHISATDNITVMAGQNEAGKSAILESLNFFRNEVSEDFKRLNIRRGTHPYVLCSFLLQDVDKQSEDEQVKAVLAELKEISCYTGDENEDKFDDVSLTPETLENISQIVDKHKVGIEAQGVQAPEFIAKLDNLLIDRLPGFILFNSFDNDLPGEIFFRDIDSNEAVLDFQKAFDVSFATLNDLDAKDLVTFKEEISTKATVDLNNYWSQTITTTDDDKYRITIDFNKNEATPDESRLVFLIDKNDKRPLNMEQMSKGFRWFNSFNLKLKSLGLNTEDLSNNVVLIDEPGQGLHESAQKDVKKVLEDLKDEGMQIVYTTHNPNLIGVNDGEILRINLVYNNKDVGTKVSNIAQFSAQNGNKDALSPIITAMGINSSGQLIDQKKTAVITEGITDHYYLSAMKKILGITKEFQFIPAVGATNTRPLLSIVISWGGKYKVCLDGDKQGRDVFREVEKNFFPNPEDKELLAQHVKKIDGADGIEDLFSRNDFKKFILPKGVGGDASKSNSEIAKEHKKELLARLFLEKADTQEIKLSKETKEKFKAVFDWLEG